MYNPLYYGYRIPQVGKFLYRVGRVYDILAMPCYVEPEIWVYAAWIDAPKLIWSLFKPDRFDLYTQRGGMLHRKRRRWRLRIHDIWDNPYIPKKGELGWGVFKGAEIAQRIGWWLVVADATTDFAVNWTSTTYQMGGCPLGGQPLAKAVQGSYYFTGADNSWTPVGFWNPVDYYVLTVTPNYIYVPALNVFSATLQPIITPYGHGYSAPNQVDFRITVDGASNVIGEISSTLENGVYKTPPLLVKQWETFAGDRKVYLWMKKDQGVFTLDGTLFACYGAKTPNLAHDP